MLRNSSTLIPLGLVAAIALGMPALAKSLQSGKANTIASASMRPAKTEKARGPNAYGSVRRTPTVGAPIPNSPMLIGGGTAYNNDFYVY